MSRKNKSADNQRGTNPPNRDVNAAQRAVLAVQLRAQMLTYEDIASRVGYSNASVCRKAILRELDRCVVKNVDELRIQELSMLNQMHSECWQLFMDKSNKARLFAADRLLSLSEARRKLMGLDQTPDGVLNAGMVVVREAPPGLLGPSQS